MSLKVLECAAGGWEPTEKWNQPAQNGLSKLANFSSAGKLITIISPFMNYLCVCSNLLSHHSCVDRDPTL